MKRLSSVIGIACLLFACGCANRGGIPHSGAGADSHTVAGELASLGSWFLWVGAIVLALGMACRIPRVASLAASFVCPLIGLIGFATDFSDIATIVTEAGGIAIALGTGFIYLSNHEWILICTAILAVVAFCIRHRYVIIDWLDLGASPVPPAASGTQTVK